MTIHGDSTVHLSASFKQAESPMLMDRNSVSKKKGVKARGLYANTQVHNEICSS